MINKHYLPALLLGLAMTLILAPTTSYAQVEFPAPSPMCKIEQRVGLTDITIEYSRPGKKDRTIFGDLVPYGQMWRTGANASTKLTFSEDVKLAGQEIPAGTYALYSIPGETEWTMVIHKNTSHWGIGEYDESEDLVRFNIEPYKMPEGVFVESMMIMVDNIRDNSCTLDMVWDDVIISMPLKLKTREAVVESLEAAMAGPSGRLHYQAARFFMNDGKNDKALEHIQIAVNEKEYSRFWSERLHSQILAELGQYEAAVEVAKKSMAMAEKEGNEDYVRMNTKSIAEWSKK